MHSIYIFTYFCCYMIFKPHRCHANARTIKEKQQLTSSQTLIFQCQVKMIQCGQVIHFFKIQSFSSD